jgi:hypothetical protein
VETITVAEVDPGRHSLYLVAGTTAVDDVIAALGHEPNGPFWLGVAELLIATEAPHLDGSFEFDDEAGALLVYSGDRAKLDELAVLLRAAAADGDRIRQLVALAADRGFEFDD